MTSPKIFSILICLLCYSCNNNTRDIERSSSNDVKGNDTGEVKVRNIHDIDKLEHDSKIADERKIDPELLTIWNRFIKIAANKNYYELKKISLDTLEVCNTGYRFDEFIHYCLPKVFDTTLLKRFSEVSYSNYLEHEVISSYMPQFLLKEIDSVGYSLKLNQFQVLKELTLDGGWTMTFDFIKTKDGYKFYSCNSAGGPGCCR